MVWQSVTTCVADSPRSSKAGVHTHLPRKANADARVRNCSQHRCTVPSHSEGVAPSSVRACGCYCCCCKHAEKNYVYVRMCACAVQTCSAVQCSPAVQCSVPPPAPEPFSLCMHWWSAMQCGIGQYRLCSAGCSDAHAVQAMQCM